MILRLCYALFGAALLCCLGYGAAASAPPKTVSYERDVKPILVSRCYACHAGNAKMGGFALDTREGLLAGGEHHPVIVPGKAAESYFMQLVEGKVPGKIMPMSGPPLTAAQLKTLRAWIDGGAKFDEAATAGGTKAAVWQPPLAPRRPVLPPARPGLTNPVDRLLAPYFAANKVAPGPVVDDRTFARRAYLDLVGLLPSPAALRAFEKDTRPDKRARLADRLLADNENYAAHWLSFWNDLLRNDYAGTGYIDGGRTQITGWLRRALETNKPYDQFVRELVSPPSAESAGFTKGIVWRGVVNASQTPPMQAAQSVGQTFLGVNLKCASCHDSFVSNWKLSDAYGLAAVFADEAGANGGLEMVRCDKPTGKKATAAFLYPALGTIDGSAPREKRQEQLAVLLTSPRNGRLARTLVNRLWTRLLGRGLVEPNDEMDSRPWNPALLDWLAADFQDHGYNIKRTLRLLVTSRAYQLPAAGQKTERAEKFVFAGPVVKRLSAEQFADAVSTLTGEWPRPAIGSIAIADAKPALPPSGRARLLFSSPVMTGGAAEIDVNVSGTEILTLVAADGGDNNAHDWADWCDARLVTPAGEVRLSSLPWHSASTGYGQVQTGKSVVEKPLRLRTASGERTFADGIGTHANSVITFRLPPGTTRFRATVGPDQGSVEQANARPSVAFFVVAGDRSLVESRASLALADPLTVALGRPNREQIVTQRATVATTLQALELTNGETLFKNLRAGAARWSETHKNAPPDILINALYQHALGRPAAPRELAAARDLLAGAKTRNEGVEDLLWAVTLLPDFQLIR